MAIKKAHRTVNVLLWMKIKVTPFGENGLEAVLNVETVLKQKITSRRFHFGEEPRSDVNSTKNAFDLHKIIMKMRAKGWVFSGYQKKEYGVFKLYFSWCAQAFLLSGYSVTCFQYLSL